MSDIDFRAGDVLTIACAFTEATVAGVARSHVSIRWPWWRRDPDAEGFDWNGNVAITDEAAELFRTDPPAGRLRAGQACRVGIPPTVVHVIAAQTFDPPLETGWLPRPAREIVVLRHGESEDASAVEQGTGLNPDDDMPLTISLLFRPFAFLDADAGGSAISDAGGGVRADGGGYAGVDVVDRYERAWHFTGPWGWHAYDGRGGAPAWPLTLLADGGGPAVAERTARVAAATRTGSHEAEIERWCRASGAEPLIR